MTLFREGSFRSHAGLELPWKIECDAFTDEDWECVARMIWGRVIYTKVESVPTGGDRLCNIMRRGCWPQEWGYRKDGEDFIRTPLLIVDDVLTTGKSMEEQRAGRDAIGFVVFARTRPAPWIRALWTWTGDSQ